MYYRILARGLLLGSVTCAGSAAASAPESLSQLSTSPSLSISGGVRVQAESISGQFRPGRPSDDFLLSVRTNILVTWRPEPVEVVFELSDARGYGQERNSPTSTSEVNALEPLQAYVGMSLADRHEIKLGRFTMELGSTRLIARPDSSNSPPAFTGLIGNLGVGRGSLTGFWTMPNLRLPGDADGIRSNDVELDRASNDLQFFGAIYSRSGLPERSALETYAYHLVEEDSPRFPTRDRAFWTYGFRLYRAPLSGRLDFDFEAARQTGRTRNSIRVSDVRDLEVDASFIHGEIGRKFAGRWNPRLSAHLDFGSGDDPDTTGVFERFDPLFGARRSDFGPTSLYGPLTRANLRSAALKLEAKPFARTDGFVSYRASWLDEPKDVFAATGLRDPAGLSGTFEGHQVEGRVRHWLLKDRVRLEVGAALLFHGTFMRHAPQAPHEHTTDYGYGSLSFKF